MDEISEDFIELLDLNVCPWISKYFVYVFLWCNFNIFD